MDFYAIKERSIRKAIEVYPDFKVGRTKDLMIRGKSFYAIWNENVGLWSTDEYDVQLLVDNKLYERKKILSAETPEDIIVKSMRDFSTNSWYSFKKLCS